MSKTCTHLNTIRDVTPSALGCEECLKTGDIWLHLRICRACGHVGCCDQSPNRHATKHFHATRHPIIEGYDPPEGWGWCYVDEVMFDLSDPQDAAQRPNPAILLTWQTRGSAATARRGAICFRRGRSRRWRRDEIAGLRRRALRNWVTRSSIIWSAMVTRAWRNLSSSAEWTR